MAIKDLITQKPMELSTVDSAKITILSDNIILFNTVGTPLVAAHGLSFYVQVQKGEKHYNILFDTGSSYEVLQKNMELLGINVNNIDSIAISHCHFDHMGGLLGIVQEMSKSITLISHPTLFLNSFMYRDGRFLQIGLPAGITKEKLIEAGVQFLFANNPVEIYPGVVTTGEINRRTDFEGKELEAYKFDPESQKLVKDDLLYEISLAVNVKGKGLVILVGCAHPGIVNTIYHSVDITGINKVHSVIGGFHLANADKDILDKTANEIESFNPEMLSAGHCTGIGAISYFNERFKNFRPFGVGTVFNI